MTTSQIGADSRAAALEALLAEIDGVPVVVDPVSVKRKSRDYYWYSPILSAFLAKRFADVVVAPSHEADVLRVAAACARHRVPLTPRGAGTGNYGQCVPLDGGVVLDMTNMSKIVSHEPGRLRVQAGARLVEIDSALGPSGWELRMHPSTKRSATIGGFVAGGSGGVGSIAYGGLREPGNILGARIVTVEEEPRVIELKGDAAQKINRAYGTTGIMTEVDMPLAPAWEWVDVVVRVDRFMEAVSLGRDLALADGIVKKLVSVSQAPLPTFFGSIRSLFNPRDSVVVCMIARPSLACFRDLVRGRGEIVLEEPFHEDPAHTPVYEYSWNHVTLQVLKVDRGVTYLQCLFPADRLIETVRSTGEALGDEQMQHLEFIRFAGQLTASALPVIRYSSAARLDEIIAIYEAAGVFIANPHVVTLEDGSRHKRADADQLGFKHEVDPLGLLNPGKMRSFMPKRAHSG